MQHKLNATIHSENRSSKKVDSPNKVGAESNDDILFAQEFQNKYDESPFWELIFSIKFSHNEIRDDKFFGIDNSDAVFDAYEFLVSPSGPYYFNLCDYNEIESFSKALILGLYANCVLDGINLRMLEKDNTKLTGFNDFLLNEFPEAYNAYCEVSKQFEFKNTLKWDGNYFSLEEKLVNGSITEDAHGGIVKIEISTQEDYFLWTMAVIWRGLGKTIEVGKSEYNLFNDILSSFSNLMGSKCIYSLDSEGHICFRLEDNEDFRESNESGLVVTLGIFSCLKLNLEFLELQNPKLQGLNEFLSINFPETYNAYRALTNEFGFDGTVKLNMNSDASVEELQTSLRNMKVVKWYNDLVIQEESVLDEAVRDNNLTGSLNENDGADPTPKKAEAKKPVMKSKTTVKKNRSKAKKRS